MGSTEEFNVEGKAGEPIPLPISRGPATGYSWMLKLPDGVRATDDEPSRPAESTTRLGASGGQRMRVIAEPGDFIIEGRLARPWQSDSPIRTVTIHLRVSANTN